jgi:DNA-binding phage protein
MNQSIMKKYLTYTLLALGIFSLVGAGAVSARGWFGGFNNTSPEEITQRFETMLQNKADLLGISVDEMQSAWAEGKTIIQIAEEQGISREQLQDLFKEARKEHLQNRLQVLVDNGVITQEQADQRLQGVEWQLGGGGFRKGFHKGFGEGCNW